MPQSGSNPVQPGDRLTIQLASCLSLHFGWAAVLRLSNWVAQLRQSISCKREDTGSIPVQKHRSRLLSILNPQSIFDGSQDWVIVHHDVVAGSSPASGTKCRSSSVVEHVFPVRFLSVGFSAGRRLWVLVNPAIPVQIRSVACDGGATLSTPGNSTVDFLSAVL